MNQPDKIVHVNFSKSFRGGEFQTLALIKALHAYGVQQELVCRRNALMAVEARQLSYLKVTEISGPLAGHFCRSEVQNKTLVHAHEARAVYWAWLEKLIRRTPYIVTRRVINQIGSAWMTRRAYQSAATLVAVSEFAARVLQARVNKTVDVVMDACRELPVGAVSAQGLEALPGSPRIGHVGEFDDAVKGQGLLIEAFLEVLKTKPDARLFLIGDGKDRATFLERYRDEGRIVFAGAVTNVHEWLRQLDVFCFPSKVEALGSSVLEAMQTGVPVIVSDAGGLPELVGEQERGLVVFGRSPENWAKAILDVLAQSTMTQKKVALAKAFASHHQAADMAGNYWKIYTKLWNQSR